jgi:hypothetical protein
MIISLPETMENKGNIKLGLQLQEKEWAPCQSNTRNKATRIIQNYS